jgi:hypothetical protein
MSKWSECSTKCITGTQTREKILNAQNGGMACGPISQDCIIPCNAINDQLQNNYFNYNELDENNKNIFIGLISLLIFILIIILFMWKKKPDNPYMPPMQYNSPMQYNQPMQYNSPMQYNQPM